MSMQRSNGPRNDDSAANRRRNIPDDRSKSKELRPRNANSKMRARKTGAEAKDDEIAAETTMQNSLADLFPEETATLKELGFSSAEIETVLRYLIRKAHKDIREVTKLFNNKALNKRFNGDNTKKKKALSVIKKKDTNLRHWFRMLFIPEVYFDQLCEREYRNDKVRGHQGESHPSKPRYKSRRKESYKIPISKLETIGEHVKEMALEECTEFLERLIAAESRVEFESIMPA